jgi:hypothetical protein
VPGCCVCLCIYPSRKRRDQAGRSVQEQMPSSRTRASGVCMRSSGEDAASWARLLLRTAPSHARLQQRSKGRRAPPHARRERGAVAVRTPSPPPPPPPVMLDSCTSPPARLFPLEPSLVSAIRLDSRALHRLALLSIRRRSLIPACTHPLTALKTAPGPGVQGGGWLREALVV